MIAAAHTRHRSRWTDEDVNVLQRLFDARQPIEVLATALGRTEAACASKLAELRFVTVNVKTTEIIYTAPPQVYYKVSRANSGHLSDL